MYHQEIITFYLFSQILEMNPEEEAEEDGANIDLDSQRKGKCVVLKTSTRQVNSRLACISHFAPLHDALRLLCFHVCVV